MIEKEKYFIKSSESRVAKRCPILDRCMRRSGTITLFNNLDVDRGINWADLKEPYIQIKGEAPYKIGGDSDWLFGALCPEVPLFEPTVSVLQFSGSPITKGQYDKYMNPSFKVLEKGHYTECAEYSDYMESKKNNGNGSGETKEKKGFFVRHWQWIIGTVIAIVGLLLRFIKI